MCKVFGRSLLQIVWLLKLFICSFWIDISANRNLQSGFVGFLVSRHTLSFSLTSLLMIYNQMPENGLQVIRIFFFFFISTKDTMWFCEITFLIWLFQILQKIKDSWNYVTMFRPCLQVHFKDYGYIYFILCIQFSVV